MKNKTILFIATSLFFASTAMTNATNISKENTNQNLIVNPGYTCCTATISGTDGDGFPERIDVSQCVNGNGDRNADYANACLKAELKAAEINPY
ncbi:hypothetical protein [uncultured Nonlabens sp.]|uniref:hypothetical protein n=1 Tax=uncultured Nonlabens sp. TaxID=859306 RepID=UPI00261EED82|nr:hypothetical protein [uncultured Nonlabens sp.]